MRILPLLVCLVTLILHGCRPPPRVRPADAAQALPNEAPGSEATVSGVRMLARFHTWEGSPPTLESVMTPILVKLENESGRAIEVRYGKFEIFPDQGLPLFPLPPFEIKGSVTRPVEGYQFPARGFWVAPYLSYHYPFSRRFHGRFHYDPFYYDLWYPQYPTYVNTPLPTWDMINRALPEGVVEPKGSITGFLYFKALDPRTKSFELRFEVVDANDGARLGMASMPFVVK